jgi:hypothetical protein
MFTGLVAGVGTLAAREARGGDARLSIDAGTLPRLLGYFSSYSATQRYRGVHGGDDPLAALAPLFADAWGDPDTVREVRWPMFVHARRKD